MKKISVFLLLLIFVFGVSAPVGTLSASASTAKAKVVVAKKTPAKKVQAKKKVVKKKITKKKKKKEKLVLNPPLIDPSHPPGGKVD